MVSKRVQCCIHVGKRCKEPFCRYIHYTRLAEKAKWEWIDQCKKELKELKEKKK